MIQFNLDTASPVWEIEYDVMPISTERRDFSNAITAARQAFQDFNLSAFQEKFSAVFGDEIANDLLAMHGNIREEILVLYMKRALDELQTINSHRRAVAAE